MLAATRLHLGVIGLQETHELGIVERTVHDFWGQKWSLHLAGPSQKPRRQGTGFLVSQEHKVIGFHPISSRVSWIELRRPKTPYEGNGKACFVSAYAPTESHSTEQDIEDFYEELKQALSAVRASLGSHLVPVMGDFNINLGNDVAGLQDLRPRVLGNSLRIGPSTPNCGKFIAFCNEEGLSILQSWQHARTMSKRTRWCTWCHPGTGQPHMKDFVLLPVEELSATKTCRPSEDMGILTDHKLVVCRINSSKARIAQIVQQAQGRHKGRLRSNLRTRDEVDAHIRRLDLNQLRRRPDLQRRFKIALEEQLEPLSADWNLTEKALKDTAIKLVPTKRAFNLKSWLTPSATAEIALLIEKSTKCRRELAKAIPAEKPQLLIIKRQTKRAIKKCVEKHKRLYKRHLVTLVTNSKNPQERKLALQQLARGNNMTSNPEQPRQDVPPEKFKQHFEQLYSKISEQESLGLTEAAVGPKSEPLEALSGPPSLYEIEHAIGKLKFEKAPGSDGLPAEIFKAGGSIIAHPLSQDYKSIWPVVGETGLPNIAKVCQAWQDAVVHTLYKGKGSRSDPNNYRGVFLLDVAGKILASVLEARIRQAADHYLSDSQNGFRARRSTSHAIHTLRRIQEACRGVDLKAYCVFVDFEKAFDSPPRTALYECLEWIGIPKDLLAIIMAIHENPQGKVSGSDTWFSVARGIRQGCVLGPTLFIILLEFAKRQVGLTELGVEFRCAKKKQLELPLDLVGVSFRVGSGEYADDMALIDTCAARLTASVNRLQEICGRIGLNISVRKTEWMYLHNPNNTELGECRAKRTPLDHCCEQIFLDGKPLKHVSSFRYLGSILSESGGMSEETRFRVIQAEISLNKYNAIWGSDLTVRQKVRLLKTHVMPCLLYATECGNHTQHEIDAINVFLNKCRRRILKVGRRAPDGTVISNQELHRRCRLPQPLDWLSRRRLNFAATMITRPPSTTARQILFGEISQEQTIRKVGGRERSSYLNVLTADLKYLNSGTTKVGDLNKFFELAFSMGPPHAKKVLKELKPDSARGSTVNLVNEREKIHSCPVEGCTAMFAEIKEVNRHVKRSHTEADVGGNGPGGGGNPNALNCPFCSRTFKTPGWLDRHVKSNHGLAVPNDPIVPPPAVIGVAVGVPHGIRNLVGRTAPNQAGRGRAGGPVSSPGDGGVGQIGSRRSRRLLERGGE